MQSVQWLIIPPHSHHSPIYCMAQEPRQGRRAGIPVPKIAAECFEHQFGECKISTTVTQPAKPASTRIKLACARSQAHTVNDETCTVAINSPAFSPSTRRRPWLLNLQATRTSPETQARHIHAKIAAARQKPKTNALNINLVNAR